MPVIGYFGKLKHGSIKGFLAADYFLKLLSWTCRWGKGSLSYLVQVTANFFTVPDLVRIQAVR